jgi:hypothetical protein
MMKSKNVLTILLGSLFLALFILGACKKDEDEPQEVPKGVVVTQTDGSTDVTEGGNTDTYSVALVSAPSDDVTINVSPDNQLSVDKNALVFTAADWNVAQEITVTAVDDDIPEGDHTGVISHTSVSDDAAWNALDLPELTVNITDNDVSLIMAGSRTGHYVIVDPQNGQDMVENEPDVHFVGRSCLGYLCRNVAIISPPGPGIFVNVIYTMDRQTAGNPVKITDETVHDVLYVSGSPVEPTLVFCSRVVATFTDHIFTISESGANETRLTFDAEPVVIPDGKVEAKLLGASMPAFSPDGGHIVFNAFLRESVTNFAHNAVMIMDKDGGNKEVLFDRQFETTHIDDPCWSADGDFVIFSYEDGGRRVVAVHVASKTVSEFTAQMEVDGTAVMNLSACPNQNKIVYNIHVPGGGKLYTVDYTTAGNTAAISGTYTQLTIDNVGHGYAGPDWQRWDGK